MKATMLYRGPYREKLRVLEPAALEPATLEPAGRVETRAPRADGSLAPRSGKMPYAASNRGVLTAGIAR